MMREEPRICKSNSESHALRERVAVLAKSKGNGITIDFHDNGFAFEDSPEECLAVK
jgi:hypothetical protein